MNPSGKTDSPILSLRHARHTMSRLSLALLLLSSVSLYGSATSSPSLSSLRHDALMKRVEAIQQKAPLKLRNKGISDSSSSNSVRRMRSSDASGSGHRVSPVDFGGDPTGRKDSLAALQVGRKRKRNEEEVGG